MTGLIDLLAQGATIFHRHVTVATAAIRYALLRWLLLLHLDLLALSLCVLSSAIVTRAILLTFRPTLVAHFLPVAAIAARAGKCAGTERAQTTENG